MDEKKIYGGLIALALVLLLWAGLAPRDSGPSVTDVVAEQIAPVSDAVADLGSRVGTLESSLGEMSEQLASAVSPDDVAAVNARVDQALAETGSLGENVAALQSALEAASAAAPARNAPEETTSAAPQDTAAEEALGTDAATPGQTVSFADGSLRLFVSRVDPAAKTVRVSVDNQMKTLHVGQPRTLEAGDDYCRITVSAVAGNSAAMDAVCGDDLPAPMGISAGTTALLADGAVRVFASRVLEDEARLSVNGAMHTLAIGRSAPTMAGEEQCRVYLDALDRGHAEVSAKCGADVAVSQAIGAGSTVLLNDGALRVFVGSVTGDQVRFSVNGQTLVSGASGASHSVGDCTVTVEDVADRKASFSSACEG